MDKQTDVNVELQQVGAYPTKQKMHQQNVTLLDEKERETTPTKQPSSENTQG
ncbi:MULTISPECIES: hypothetical protein [Bacillales]|jgi:hypothetical protein|uniref:Orphan protein n=1 Tax=Brevibacillus aydinogluensis TaxID=927786 RepID=A0AA48RHK1_9BACL|nr:MULTISPECIES: hypothetical protein [Bacillales]MBR8658398.1 hypothetical protein [Brevibacillus sp. NL20B1]MDT3415534.1 hypothetical protein [Brevibacillus aydinogluensis]UFJ60602.1 hypothetical protein IRT44_15195 [Anoxybacillus sediminis]CAJ1002683.1 Orphan protein [Brevibacillus aydinogluensis]